MVCDKVVCERDCVTMLCAEEEAERDTESKPRTPQKDVGIIHHLARWFSQRTKPPCSSGITQRPATLPGVYHGIPPWNHHEIQINQHEHCLNPIEIESPSIGIWTGLNPTDQPFNHQIQPWTFGDSSSHWGIPSRQAAHSAGLPNVGSQLAQPASHLMRL
jgi:hypothetical protein